MDQYGEMGIDSKKKIVEDVFGRIISSDFPFAFINMKREPWMPGWVRSKKCDGDGSKSVYRWLHYLENRDVTIFKGAVDDAFGMALGDLCAGGIFQDLEITDTLHCNPLNLPKEVYITAMRDRFAELKTLYARYQIYMEFFGGETADLPIQENATSFDVDVRGHDKEEFVIKGETKPYDRIWGLASTGKAVWEEKENSGIMSNGLHLGARLTLHPYYRKYPYLTHPTKPYNGRFMLDEELPWVNMKAEDALLSNTRQFPIIFMMLIYKLIARGALSVLHGITLNSGGGATKILRLGNRIRYIKKMPPLPPYFKFLQSEGNVGRREMFRDFNCGVGADIIGSNEGGILFSVLCELRQETGIAFFELGGCERAEEENEVVLETEFGTEIYKKSDLD